MEGKVIFSFLVLILLIANVSASVEILKPATFNKSYIILQTCASCTYVNLTVSNVNGIIVNNEEMSDNGSGTWVYTITPTIMSRHDVTGQGDVDGTDTSFVTYFEVNPSDLKATTADSILYSLFSLVLFGLIFVALLLIFIVPSNNDRDEGGFESKIIRLKYFRVVLIMITYGLTILLLNFLTGLSTNFSALTIFAGLLSFLFETMLRVAWVFTLLMIVWIVVMLIHDSNVSKRIKNMENLNIFEHG